MAFERLCDRWYGRSGRRDYSSSLCPFRSKCVRIHCCTGVTAGSITAGVQSAVYAGAVASASAFATLQSVGASGLGTAATFGLFSAGAGAAN